MTEKVTIDIERVVRDAIIGYENTYCEVHDKTDDKGWLEDLMARIKFANRWLEDNGYKPEPMCEIVKKAATKGGNE